MHPRYITNERSLIAFLLANPKVIDAARLAELASEMEAFIHLRDARDAARAMGAEGFSLPLEYESEIESECFNFVARFGEGLALAAWSSPSEVERATGVREEVIDLFDRTGADLSSVSVTTGVADLIRGLDEILPASMTDGDLSAKVFGTDVFGVSHAAESHEALNEPATVGPARRRPTPRSRG